MAIIFTYIQGYFYVQCAALPIHPSLYPLPLLSLPLSLIGSLNTLIKSSHTLQLCRIHITLHFNYTCIDLHLLYIMVIVRLVLLIAYGSLEQDHSH